MGNLSKKLNGLFEKGKIMLVMMDIITVLIACFIARILVFNSIHLSNMDITKIINTFLVYTVISQIIYKIFDFYHNITSYESGMDYVTYMFANIIAIIISILFNLSLNIYLLRNREIILVGIITSVFMIGYRVIIRYFLSHHVKTLKSNDSDDVPKNLLLIGAGSAARDIIRTINNSSKLDYCIIGLIDDNPKKFNYNISGYKILGNRNDIVRICKKYEIDEIFFTISSIDSKNKKEILDVCQEANVKVKVLPSTEDLICGKSLVDNLKDVQIEDLLSREPITLDNNNIQDIIKDKVVLVTGGGGSIGSELCRQIIRYNPKQLVIFDIYENNLYDIQMELNFKHSDANVVGIIGSVRDKKKLEKVFETYKPNLVFHAAAHKHVPLMEVSPLEAIKNNVFGTKNVADLADKHGVSKMILVSTDKAVNPTNIMGASKRMCEIIIQNKNRNSKTDYAAVRFGNVLGSNGSVIPLFKKQIKEGGPVTVTDKEITRYFMTIPEAVSLILQAMTYANGGEIFVLDMGKPVKIYDLAVNLIKLSGYVPDVDIPIEITGLRPGEKLIEELLMGEEGLTKTSHNKIFVAKPLDISSEDVENRISILSDLIKSEDHTYEEIKETIKKVVPTFYEPDVLNKIIEEKRKKNDIESNKMSDSED